MYKHLVLNDSVSPEYSNPTFIKDFPCIPNLSKINILVGANNSGKSRLLRHLLKDDFQGIRCTEEMKSSVEAAANSLASSNNIYNTIRKYPDSLSKYKGVESNPKLWKAVLASL